MNQLSHIYSLSPLLKTLNSNLSKHINVIDTSELLNIITEVKPNAILFEERHIPSILKIFKTNKNIEVRFICISRNLDPDDRLILLNHNIECITTEKFSEISTAFFELESEKSLYKVLIVEDDENQVFITEHILTSANIEVQSVSDSTEVIKALNSFKPNLILMDLYLDGITGDELVKNIRLSPQYRLLPIVFLTSDASIETRMNVLNAGADDLLTKPINAELLVSALINRMQRNLDHQSDIPDTNKQVVLHDVNENNSDKLITFFNNNLENSSASIIWGKVNNKLNLQKELGYTGFQSLCDSILRELHEFTNRFNIKSKLAEGVFVLASDSLDFEKAKKWVKDLNDWLLNNFFSIRGKDYYITISSIILSGIPTKKAPLLLLQNAEHLLIDIKNNQELIVLEDENLKEKQFDETKKQLEKAIKTRNFNWEYTTILSTKNQSQKIYQLELIIATDSDDRLFKRDYTDVARKTGMLALLNRFMLEHAIRIIRAGEQKNISTIVLLEQKLVDYQSKELRLKLVEVIKRLKLPIGSLMFQFDLVDAQENIDLLKEIGRELKQANIKICLSGFVPNEIAWGIARKLNISWMKFKKFSKNSSILDEKSAYYLPKAIKKAQILCYKTMMPRLEDLNLSKDLKGLNLDYLQGMLVKSPVSKKAK